MVKQYDRSVPHRCCPTPSSAGSCSAPGEIEPAEIEHEVQDGETLPGRLRAIHVPGDYAGQLAFLRPQHGGVVIAADTAANVFGLALNPMHEDYRRVVEAWRSSRPWNSRSPALGTARQSARARPGSSRKSGLLRKSSHASSCELFARIRISGGISGSEMISEDDGARTRNLRRDRRPFTTGAKPVRPLWP